MLVLKTIQADLYLKHTIMFSEAVEIAGSEIWEDVRLLFENPGGPFRLMDTRWMW